MLSRGLIATLLATFLLVSTPALAIQPSQGGGTGGSNCAPTFVVGSIVGVVSAGQIDTCVYYSPTELTTAGVSQFTWISTGPAATGGLASYAPSFIGMAGCTATGVTTDTSITAAGTMATGSATITMTGRDCRGYFQIELAVGSGAISLYLVRFALNVHVVDNYLLTFNCDSTGATAADFDPATDTCDTLGVDIIDDTTDDGKLTTTGADVSIGNQSVAFPDQFHLCGAPDPEDPEACPAVAAQAGVTFPGGVDSPNLSWILLLVFLSVLVAAFWWLGMAFTLGWSVAALIVHVLPVENLDPALAPLRLATALFLVIVGVVLQYLNERRGERSQAPEDQSSSGVV